MVSILNAGPKDLDIERAKHALKKVNEVKTKEDYGHFRSYVERLPATVVMNGLGQAMAMELSQSKKADANRKADERAHEKLFEIVQDWLNKTVYDDGDLMENITSSNQQKYIEAQSEALAYLVWLKKFSKAYLEKGG